MSAHISTHAPRVGRNLKRIIDVANERYFYSRAPSGAQLSVELNSVWAVNFYSRAPSGAQPTATLYHTVPLSKFLLTRPEWGATGTVSDQLRQLQISTHAPRVGRNRIRALQFTISATFLLTRPEWGATLYVLTVCLLPIFLLTRPEWGATTTGNVF